MASFGASLSPGDFNMIYLVSTIYCIETWWDLGYNQARFYIIGFASIWHWMLLPTSKWKLLESLKWPSQGWVWRSILLVWLTNQLVLWAISRWKCLKFSLWTYHVLCISSPITIVSMYLFFWVDLLICCIKTYHNFL